MIFVDEAGIVSARRWCWRQAAESASGSETTEVLVTVEGHHDGAADEVAVAIADLEALIRAHTHPSAMASGILNASAPTFLGLAASPGEW